MAFLVHCFAEEFLIKEKVPELISWEQLQAFKKYWARPWMQQEKALLATLVAEGSSMGDIAKRLERSEYAVTLALRPRSKKAFEQWRIDSPMLVKRENFEAIRCVQKGIVRKLA
ncbi:MAG: hypothetical protein NTY41_08595 [Proteobacteria bacterium]|nr:hypothetical protein [Pseudomonadota bacterium]